MDVEAMDNEGLSWFCCGERDWWPLTRLLVVGLVFGVIARWKFGWHPHPRDAWAIPGSIVMILSFIVMLSSGLAHICLVALMFPLCGIILCNDWFYDATCWLLRRALRLKSRTALAIGGLCGELAFFLSAGLLLHRLTVGH